MSRSLVWRLIVKDFQLHSVPVIMVIVIGALGLIVVQARGLFGLLGIIVFFTSMILLSNLLPHGSILAERKTHSLAFMMSLPISAIQYTTAKMLSAFGMFLIPWLTLVAAAVSALLTRGDVPGGLIPLTLILVMLPLVGFCLMMAISIVGESEGGVIATTILTNVGYSLVWPVLISNSEVKASLASRTPVWSPTILTILGSELVVAAALVAITFYLQSRKRDFV